MRRQQTVAKAHSAVVPASEGTARAERSVSASSTITYSEYSGPVAPPEIAEGWERVVPGGADRLLKMAERQGEHRRHIEKVVVWGRTVGSNLGTVGAIVVALAAMYFGYNLVMHDKAVEGFVAFFGPLATLVWAYRRATSSTPPPQKPKSKTPTKR